MLDRGEPIHGLSYDHVEGVLLRDSPFQFNIVILFGDVELIIPGQNYKFQPCRSKSRVQGVVLSIRVLEAQGQEVLEVQKRGIFVLLGWGLPLSWG